MLKPVDDRTPTLAVCSHSVPPGSHVPFASFYATCPGCNNVYVVRGCGDASGKRTLPPDPKTQDGFGVVNVECECGTVVDVGVPAEAIPDTLIASLRR